MPKRKPAVELAKRERVIRAARQTTHLEGTKSTDATRADQDAYVRGDIDVEQLGTKVRARYGLR